MNFLDIPKNIKVKIHKACSFYSWFYLFYPIIIMFELFFVALAFHEKNELAQGNIYIFILLPIGFIYLICWSKIFRALSHYFKSDIENDMHRNDFPFYDLSKLLTIAFVAEFLCQIFIPAVFSIPHSPDWQDATLPRLGEPIGLLLVHIFLWCFKFVKNCSFFITPRTTGLSTLVLAGIFRLLAKDIVVIKENDHS